ncbi:LicD family protein [Vibrio alginolyticus]|uniref:LicD family protein n=1 Tax=Vibrio TaxID=662 RepID=UPI00215BC932|nr:MULTISPECIES: LicD family protein [Vibrio]MCR9593121.1 LicD family protein [Vibrio alginolyticus]MDW1762630.1 LicD family protein [Vibrio sp. Vb2135]
MEYKELTLREIQESSFSILKDIDAVCKKLNIDYFVMYGTLIGAVRHEGFIPWDDDLDIMMPRDDYDKLISYLNTNKIPNLELFNYNKNDNYPYMISRISDSRYKIVVDNEDDYGIGTFIDVYPLDYISDNYFFAKCKGRYFGWLSSLYFLSTRKYCPQSSSVIKSYVKKGAFYCSKLIGKRTLKKLLLMRQRKETQYFACTQWMTNDYERNIFHKDVISKRTFLNFEGLDVPVPKEYHKLLTDYYGDYMSFPPIELQKPHHLYKAYKIK